jgi:hypothetical protein
MRKMNRRFGACTVLALAACAGRVTESPPQGQMAMDAGVSAVDAAPSVFDGAVDRGDGSADAAVSCAQGASFAPARLLVITDNQYRNIVRDVFGVTIPSTYVITQPPSDTGSYTYNEAAQIDQGAIVQTYSNAADEVASLLTSLPPCAPGAVDATCLQTFLSNQVPLAWRRPMTSDELSGLMNIFNLAAMDDQATQIQLVMEAVLLYPAFLYRSEIGTNAANMTSGKIALTPYELAAAVSFAMFNSVPDPELWSKAQDGSITTPSVLASEVTRLMTVPAAHAFLTNLVSSYLDFEYLPFVIKDPVVYPQFAALQPVLYQSSQMFLNDLMWNGGVFNDLFTSRRIYTNEAMSAAYGLPPVTGTQLQPVTTAGDMYNAGLLTQPALLAASNKEAAGDDVIHRGLWPYYALVCGPLLPPPPPTEGTGTMQLTGDSTRYQAAYRDGPIAEADGGVVAGSGCGVGCHDLFDPLGLVTMSYDGIGRYRTTDPSTTPPNGPVDDSANIPVGVLAGVSANTMVNGTPFVHVNDANDLAQLFVQGRQVSDCAADTLTTYALEHSPDTENSCDLQTVKDAFKESGALPGLFASVLESPAFLTRDIENP